MWRILGGAEGGLRSRAIRFRALCFRAVQRNAVPHYAYPRNSFRRRSVPRSSLKAAVNRHEVAMSTMSLSPHTLYIAYVPVVLSAIQAYLRTDVVSITVYLYLSQYPVVS